MQYLNNMGGELVPNRLIKEKSPYLLQHANNPVDWYPWADEALLPVLRKSSQMLLNILR